MRVLVCGGRDFDDIALVYECLTELHPSVVIHGGCPTGVDMFADSWADPVVPREVYKADWNKHGKAAGPIRNQLMIDEGKPDVVLAFSGGRGTADMVRRAKVAGLPIIDPCNAHTAQENLMADKSLLDRAIELLRIAHVEDTGEHVLGEDWHDKADALITEYEGCTSPQTVTDSAEGAK